MALNPNIPLAVRGVDVGQAFNNALLNVGRIQQMQQNQAQSQQNQQINQQTMQQNALKQLVTVSPAVLDAAQNGDVAGLRSLATSLPQQAQQDFLGMVDSGDFAGIATQAQRLSALAPQLGLSGTQPGAEFRTFEALTAGLSPDDREKALRIQLGLDPRAGISAQERIATDPALTEQVAESEAEIKARQERAKAQVKLETEPQITAAVESAKQGAAAVAKQAGTQRDNQTAWNVYNTGMESLSNALGGTETGAFVGLLPAVTANQQIAEGAIAAMAPVLKQMFRAAGEGVFTDKDQEMLIRMVPTRSDLAEARVAKIAGIDAIVRAKLGIGDQPQQSAQPQITQPPAQQQVIRFDAQGNMIQ